MNLGNRHNQHSFAQVPQANMARSKFDRSFAVKDTMDFDYLIPILADEVLPGDTVNLNAKFFARLAPQVVPLMDNMYIDTYYFFVPNRLVWDNWERFNGAQDDPGDSIDFLVPSLDALVPGFTVGSIYDHMGLPTGIDTTNETIQALPLRMYYLIWNQWFRDQNLQNSLVVPKGDGPDDPADYVLQKGGKKHDYFTSCLPYPQKGALGVSMEAFGIIPVERTSEAVGWQAYLTGTDTLSGAGSPMSTTAGSSIAIPGNTVSLDPVGGLFANASVGGTPLSISINAFREAIMLQSLLERDARGGTRYTEILKSHFNVISPDFRLQRAEFLGSNTERIQQHVVAQTSETATTPQGNLAAYSTSMGQGGSGFSKSFVEHGWIIGLMKARADITYQQGLNRKWTRQTRYDYFWPTLQQLGEQAILNKEIVLTGTLLDDNSVFGYQERYAEYRYSPSEIRGQFRSTFANTLDVWHLAEEFVGGAPGLNATFIQSQTPIERSLVLPDPAYPQLLVDIWFDYKAARPMMTYGVPATLGRF